MKNIIQLLIISILLSSTLHSSEINLAKIKSEFISSFKPKYQPTQKKKIDKLNIQIQKTMFKFYSLGIKHLQPNERMKFSMRLLIFFDKYNSLSGNSEKYAQSIKSKFPSLPKKLTQTLIEFGNESDEELEGRLKQQEGRLKQQYMIINLLEKLNQLDHH